MTETYWERYTNNRKLDRLVAEAIGELRTSHPGFYWQEYATEDGDGGDGFSCPRCGKSVSDPDESTEGDCYKSYSTHIEDAMQAWAWLEENNPWNADILLGKDRFLDNPLPSVVVMGSNWDSGFPDVDSLRFPHTNFCIQGKTYSHAIALAVIEATKEMKKK